MTARIVEKISEGCFQGDQTLENVALAVDHRRIPFRIGRSNGQLRFRTDSDKPQFGKVR
jgi:hypothetical protein